MGMISFFRKACEELFGIGKVQAAEPPAAPPSAGLVAALIQAASQAITNCLQSMHLTVDAMDVALDGANQTVTVSGIAPDHSARKKVVLCCCNVVHVAAVNDLMTVATP